MKPRRAIFLDRDGTLIQEKHYLHKPDEVEIFPGTLHALERAVQAGFILVMVTNQSGVGRGYFTMRDVENVHEHLARELAVHNLSFIRIYVAPEAPESPSRGRKPSPQFLFDARDEYDIDLAGSYMIGDKMADLECGWNAGVRASILVRTGYGAELEQREAQKLKGAIIVNNLSAAVDWILAQDQTNSSQFS